jgi:hypothetical protein
VLAGIAAWANVALDRRADEYLAGDLDTLARPLRATTIGHIDLHGRGWSRGETRCDHLCQRLLLSGAAERVLVAELRPRDNSWSAETPAFAFRIEPRATCPPIHLVERGREPGDDDRPEEVMRVAVASGRCLIEERATLAEADAIIATGPVHTGANEVSAGLTLAADTLMVHRASVHVRERGILVERYRWTGVRMFRHPPIPIPSLVGGAELRMHPGFIRVKALRNEREPSQVEVQPVRFARDELGLDVSVPVVSREAVIAGGLEAATVQPAIQQLIEDFFKSLDERRIDEATRKLAFRVLADPRVTAPRETWALVRACDKSGDAVNTELALILFRRIMTTDPALREDHPSYLGYPVGYLANAIRLLPPESVRAHRRELEEIARDPARRRRAFAALAHLPVFGAGVVPTLLFLVDEGIALRSAQQSRKSYELEDWQPVYRSGLAGLCRLGSEAEAALAPMTARLREGALSDSRSSGDLLLATMVRLGADPELLRATLARDKSADDLAIFERDLERARSRPECEP